MIVVACGPSGFGGSGHIMTSSLLVLAKNGVQVHYVGERAPFHWDEGGCTSRAKVHSLDRVRSEAIGPHGVVASDDALLSDRLTNRLIETCSRAHYGGERTLIWGHYLVPYGAAAVSAAHLLAQMGIKVPVWLTPAGSDVWELLPQLPHACRGLLTAHEVTTVLTYSGTFAREVGQWTNKPVRVFKPSVSPRLAPPSADDRRVARESLGLKSEDFVISLHCNMRSIKDPSSVVDVARRVAAGLSPRRVVLLMAGPMTPIALEPGLLEIRQMGVVQDMRSVLFAANVELNLSRHDSFNLSLAEAMATGIPVVSTDVVGIAEDIRSANCGVLVPLASKELGEREVGQYEDAVEAICRLAMDDDALDGMGDRGARWAAKELSESALWIRLSSLLA